MKLSEILTNHIQAYGETEPNVLIFVDQQSLYWVTDEDNGYYVWLQDHSGIDQFLDTAHKLEAIRPTSQSTEGVGTEGVYWMNGSFEAPFHITDFEKRISQINITI